MVKTTYNSKEYANKKLEIYMINHNGEEKLTETINVNRIARIYKKNVYGYYKIEVIRYSIILTNYSLIEFYAIKDLQIENEIEAYNTNTITINVYKYHTTASYEAAVKKGIAKDSDKPKNYNLNETTKDTKNSNKSYYFPPANTIKGTNDEI